MATGGDGYPNFASRMTTQDIMEQVEADYITAHSPLAPVVKAVPERTHQLHGLERRRGAELSDARRVSVGLEAGGPPRPAAGTHSPTRSATSTCPAAERRASIQSRSSPAAQRGRVAEDAGDREGLAVGAARNAPPEDALDQLGLLLTPGGGSLARPVDAMVAPLDEGRPVGDLCHAGAAALRRSRARARAAVRGSG